MKKTDEKKQDKSTTLCWQILVESRGPCPSLTPPHEK